MTESRQMAGPPKDKVKWQDVENWTDPDLVLYFQKKLMLDEGEAIEILQETKKFLLVANNNYTEDTNLSPSPRVDEAWHFFILFTPLYNDFCESVLKRDAPIPHIPNVGRWRRFPSTHQDKDPNESYKRTVVAIETEVGPINKKYWPNPEVQGFGLSCRSCCTPCKATPTEPKS